MSVLEAIPEHSWIYFITCRRSKKSLFIILFSTIHFACLAQFDSLGLNAAWNPGTLVLNDFSTLRGYIKNNDKLGLIKFKNNLDDESEESFQEKRILTMEYFDNVLSKSRTFTTVYVKNDQSGFHGDLLVEVIMELHDFAVLSKVYSVSMALRERRDYYGISSHAKVGYEQFEEIYLVGEDKEGELLLVSSEFEKDKSKPFASKLKPYFNDKLLQKYLGLKWQQVNAFIKERKLSMKTKADLLVALEYFAELERDE